MTPANREDIFLSREEKLKNREDKRKNREDGPEKQCKELFITSFLKLKKEPFHKDSFFVFNRY